MTINNQIEKFLESQGQANKWLLEYLPGSEQNVSDGRRALLSLAMDTNIANERLEEILKSSNAGPAQGLASSILLQRKHEGTYIKPVRTDVPWAGSYITITQDNWGENTEFNGDRVLTGAKIDGDYALAGATISGLSALNTASLTGYSVLKSATLNGKRMLLGSSIKGHSALERATVEGENSLFYITVAGRHALQDARMKGDWTLAGADVNGDWTLAGANVEGRGALRGATVKGDMALYETTLNDKNINASQYR